MIDVILIIHYRLHYKCTFFYSRSNGVILYVHVSPTTTTTLCMGHAKVSDKNGTLTVTTPR